MWPEPRRAYVPFEEVLKLFDFRNLDGFAASGIVEDNLVSKWGCKLL